MAVRTSRLEASVGFSQKSGKDLIRKAQEAALRWPRTAPSIAELRKERNSLIARVEKSHQQGDHYVAIVLATKALALMESELGTEHPDVASLLNDLAGFHEKRRRYADAEPLHRRALAIREKMCGAEHPDVATSLAN